MFKNNVFNVSVDTKKWLKATSVRCIRSAAFTALSIIPTSGATMGNVNWVLVGSSALASVIITALVCVTGIPEVKDGE